MEERRRQILSAAAAVFARSGYHGTRTWEIAKEAGVAEGTIYNYYSSKRDLLIALTEQIVTESILATLIQADEEDPRSWFTSILRDRLDMLDRYRNVITAVASEMMTDMALREEYLRQVVLPIFAQFLPVTQQFQFKHLRPFSPRVILPAIVGSAVVAFIFHEFTDIPIGKTESREELITELVDFFLDGLRRRDDGDAAPALPQDTEMPDQDATGGRQSGLAPRPAQFRVEASGEGLISV